MLNLHGSGNLFIVSTSIIEDNILPLRVKALLLYYYSYYYIIINIILIMHFNLS
jgi:hypothetical protein